MRDGAAVMMNKKCNTDDNVDDNNHAEKTKDKEKYFSLLSTGDNDAKELPFKDPTCKPLSLKNNTD